MRLDLQVGQGFVVETASIASVRSGKQLLISSNNEYIPVIVRMVKACETTVKRLELLWWTKRNLDLDLLDYDSSEQSKGVKVFKNY